jgi:hypothetical protein
MLGGRLPFDGPPFVAIAAGITPEPLAALAPDAPDDLVSAIEQCLNPDRKRRWRTAGELRDALAEVRSPARPTRWRRFVRWWRRRARLSNARVTTMRDSGDSQGDAPSGSPSRARTSSGSGSGSGSRRDSKPESQDDGKTDTPNRSTQSF